MQKCAPILYAALATVLAQGSAFADTSKEERPNFVVIFIDDMGFADPSCFGNTLIETPNIHKLAAEGIKLTNFYVNSPICSASRVALTTGQYQGRWKIHSFLNTRAGMPGSNHQKTSRRGNAGEVIDSEMSFSADEDQTLLFVAG